MTYPKVSEIRPWPIVDGKRQYPWTASERDAHDKQQQRIEAWRAQSIQYPQNPTVCPKR